MLVHLLGVVWLLLNQLCHGVAASGASTIRKDVIFPPRILCVSGSCRGIKA